MTHDTDPNRVGTPAEPAETDQISQPQEAVAPEAETHAELSSAAEGRLQELEQEAAEFKEKWLRAEADNQNLRTRAKRDVEDARQYAVQKFARDVVEAAENLRRALASLPAHQEGEDSVLTKMREGIESTERSFISILERHGIKCEDAQGKTFDANLHQAMAEQPSAEHAPGTVMQAWTPTWTLHGRLLKPAMVVVAKAPE
ncbi:nucleotide exchange factor GrpE [Acetobacter tropicalis]|uniref:Protein GrpE n=1 Tax=Acetobacter tropicalis TaxID=104102 RepID=A0A094Z191_9PROT|nr:nucleotide exchange factor GrpE [Acetobacter tropicalis]KAA8390990.1 nucleotide exchange factor GrpE [Acetobacter tropicalis]KAA8392576.1 nucleotide exchange factor GrpE [Acetobacter tropicalis]KGB26699.1 Heat shock protein GrpE [Acetobacter tropicalis]MBC9009177.1 nucleotide exchange factor GrpE [Acetobacter tropicalis]MDO8171853.1 nucleotide exchange factor GrpE [Acetobacter tropicalis]